MFDPAAEVRKLKARWTREAEEVIAAWHGLGSEDLRGELTRLIAEEINAEIDAGTIEDIRVSQLLPIISTPQTNISPWYTRFANASQALQRRMTRIRDDIKTEHKPNWKKEWF